MSRRKPEWAHTSKTRSVTRRGGEFLRTFRRHSLLLASSWLVACAAGIDSRLCEVTNTSFLIADTASVSGHKSKIKQATPSGSGRELARPLECGTDGRCVPVDSNDSMGHDEVSWTHPETVYCYRYYLQGSYQFADAAGRVERAEALRCYLSRRQCVSSRQEDERLGFDRRVPPSLCAPVPNQRQPVWACYAVCAVRDRLGDDFRAPEGEEGISLGNVAWCWERECFATPTSCSRRANGRRCQRRLPRFSTEFP